MIPLIVELKVANALIRRILIGTEGSIDVITLNYLKRFKHPRREIFPLVHPILGFGGWEVNPTGVIRLSVRFGDRPKARNLEVDFLVIDVPTVCTVILGKGRHCIILVATSV